MLIVLSFLMSLEIEGKVIPTGNSLAVILPRDWIKHHNLKAKDPLKLIIDEDLVISPLNGGKHEEKSENN